MCSQRIERSTGLTTKLQAPSSNGKKVRRGEVGDGNLVQVMMQAGIGVRTFVPDLPWRGAERLI